MSEKTNQSSAGKRSGEWTAGLYSGAGILILLAITIGINMIAGGSSIRKDFTEDRIFTLSEGTRNILDKLDTPVTIRFYATKDQENMPPVFRSFAQRVEDMLSEYDKYGGKNLKVEKYDPEPLSDAEDLAKLDGIEPQNVDLFDKIYLGISVRMLDETASIPFLSLNRENLLEYDISRMISQVATPEKPKVGVISSLPVFGSQMNPMMMQMGQQSQPKWVVIRQLEQLFEVEELDSAIEEIPEDLDVLMLIHPKELGDATLYAIDQYVLGGGKLIAMVDPAANVDQSGANPQNPMQSMMQNRSNLEKLFSAWGLEFSNQVVADRRYSTQIRGRNGMPEERPGILTIDSTAMSDTDILTADIDSALFVWAGAFEGEPVEGLNKSDLIFSSGENQLVDAMMAQMGGENILKEFTADEKKYVLACRLDGTFPTAFPDGKPAGEEEPGDGEDGGNDGDAASHLKTSTGKPAVLLVGDVDYIYDQYAFRMMNFFNQQIAQPQNGNSSFFFSMVEQMSGDENLIAIRGRATLSRPFTKFRELRLAAQKKVEDEQQRIQDELAKAQEEINRLQSLKQEGSQDLALSPEQRETLREFRKKEFEANQKLKDIQKKLNRDTEAVQRNWQIVQIVLVPLAVAVLGIVVATFKRINTAAK